MRSSWLVGGALGLSVDVSRCGVDRGGSGDGADGHAWVGGEADGPGAVNVQATNLDVDLAAKSAVATIELEKYGNVSLEVGGLKVSKVTDGRGNRRFRIVDGKLLVSNVR